MTDERTKPPVGYGWQMYAAGIAEGERRTVERIAAWHRNIANEIETEGEFAASMMFHEMHRDMANAIECGDWRTPTTGAGGDSE